MSGTCRHCQGRDSQLKQRRKVGPPGSAESSVEVRRAIGLESTQPLCLAPGIENRNSNYYPHSFLVFFGLIVPVSRETWNHRLDRNCSRLMAVLQAERQAPGLLMYCCTLFEASCIDFVNLVYASTSAIPVYCSRRPTPYSSSCRPTPYSSSCCRQQ